VTVFRAVSLSLTLGTLLAACDGAAIREGVPTTGRPVPAFQAMSLEGDTVSLADLVGSPVLLNLWATWCVPCRRETPYLQGVHERFGPRGLLASAVRAST
jgi:thiol-disulfide isomerase/thioredoxin